MDISTLERHALATLRKPLTLKDALLEVSDFRLERRKKYPLYEVLMIAVCAMVAGAKGPTDFERFGKLKLKFLKKFLPLQNGIPSHDTFRRILGKTDPKRFNAALVKWLESASDVTGDVISIDGKLLRRALTKDGKMPCIVSAYSRRYARTGESRRCTGRWTWTSTRTGRGRGRRISRRISRCSGTSS